MLAGFLTDQSMSAAAIVASDGSMFALTGRRDGSGMSGSALQRLLTQDRGKLEGLRRASIPTASGMVMVESLGGAAGKFAEQFALAVDYSLVDGAAAGDFLFLLAEGLITVAAVAVALNRLLGKVVSPIDRLTGVMRDLVSGDLSAEIPDQRRNDEIGELARAIDFFKRSLVDRNQLQADVDTRRDEERARRAALESMIAGFRLEIHDVL